MDFDLKGKLLAGNLYNQFETICRGVDDFVSKDTLKFVENRMQGVGTTVQRFYSNVVQDILPHSVDTVKPKSNLVDNEQVDMENHVSTSSINSNSTFIDAKQTFLTQGGSVHLMKDSDTSLGDSDTSFPIKVDHIMQFSEPPVRDLSTEVDNCLQSRECRDAISEEGDLEEEIARDSTQTLLGDSDTSLPIEVEYIMQFSEPPVRDLSTDADNSLQLRECRNAMIQNGEEGDLEEQIARDSTQTLLGDSDTSLPIEVGYIMQFSELPVRDLSTEADYCLQLRECRDAIIQNGEEGDLEEEITRDSTPVTANSSLNHEMFSGASNKDDNNLTLTGHDIGLTSCINESWHFNHQKGNKIYFEYAECLSDSSSNVRLLESRLTVVENQYFDDNGSSFGPSVTSTLKVNEKDCLLMESPLSSERDANTNALGNDMFLSDNSYTEDNDFHLLTSVKSPTECMFLYDSWKEKEERIMSSCNCTSPKSSSVLESTSTGSHMKAENICHHGECDGFSFNTATPLISVPDVIKGVDALPCFLITDSNENNVKTDRSELVEGSCACRQQHHKDGHSDILMRPSETANIYEFRDHSDDFDMETIDLSSDLKDDGTIVVMNSNSMHPVHHRKNFKYYKKLIQDAFTSQKRISKEYVHLSLLYGDINMESNQHCQPSSASSFISTVSHAVKSHSSLEMSETEWELL